MDEREIQEMVKAGLSQSNISYMPKRRHPGVKGFLNDPLDDFVMSKTSIIVLHYLTLT